MIRYQCLLAVCKGGRDCVSQGRAVRLSDAVQQAMSSAHMTTNGVFCKRARAVCRRNVTGPDRVLQSQQGVAVAAAMAMDGAGMLQVVQQLACSLVRDCSG